MSADNFLILLESQYIHRKQKNNLQLKINNLQFAKKKTE